VTAVAPSGGPIAASRGAGAAALALAGVLFGSTFLVVQDAVERASVTAFLAARFLLAAAVLWPIARRRPSSVDEVRHGVLAGLSLLAGYLLQTEGLRHTTSATSAFITYLLVVLVPLLHSVRTRRPPTGAVVVGVVLSVAGLLLLSGGVAGFGRGEVLRAVRMLVWRSGPASGRRRTWAIAGGRSEIGKSWASSAAMRAWGCSSGGLSSDRPKMSVSVRGSLTDVWRSRPPSRPSGSGVR